ADTASGGIPPAGSRVFPLRSAATAPASMVRIPFGSSEPAIHFLRAVTGLAGVRNQVQRAPSAIALSGCASLPDAITIWVPPWVAILPASTLVCMPPRESSDPAAPDIAPIAGVMRSTRDTKLSAALTADAAA